MKDLLVQDNFLEKSAFKIIYDNLVWDKSEEDDLYMLSMPCPWNWGPVIPKKRILDNDYEQYNFQLTHVFYNTMNYIGSVTSDNYTIIHPLVEKIKPASIRRIKANLNPVTDNIIEHGYHVDHDPFKYETTTSIYYVNTNNGYTKFEDGTVVKSIANRLITFPASNRHTSSTCTDKPQRVVINFNYFI